MKVADILANVRKSVDADMDNLANGTASQTRGTLMRGALREMRINMGTGMDQNPTVTDDISDLRRRIKQKMEALPTESFSAPVKPAPSPPKPTTAVVPTRGDFSGILSGPSTRNNGLRPSHAGHELRDDLRYAPQTQRWAEPEQPAYVEEAESYRQPDPYAQGYGYEEEAYVSPPQHVPLVSSQTEAQTETAFRQLSDAILARATGDRNLEELTRDMLKGMLKQWLDANLPTIVEELVREEIQRVARRGR